MKYENEKVKKFMDQSLYTSWVMNTESTIPQASVVVPCDKNRKFRGPGATTTSGAYETVDGDSSRKKRKDRIVAR